ncbi:MAG TPA: ABC transporter permease [Nocardioides sp.]|uniref:ABC transporter permease n=1 Tax=Nocardioides sp. TaxID=35761 RepID=UPI002F3E66BA
MAEPEAHPPEQTGRPRPTLTAPKGPRETLGSAPEAAPPVSRSQLQLARERFFHHKPAVAGLVVFVSLLLLSTIGGHFWHYSYSDITAQYSTGPSLQHPFGTDTIGHDLFAQVLLGTATSIKTAIVVAALATVVGTLIGALAGYYGTWADFALMRFTDLVLTVPLFAVLLVLANTLGKQANSWFWIAIILAALLWTYLARLVRGSFLSLREREFVEAEWAIGASDARIIVRHLIPNALGPIVVNATLTVAVAMLIEAALSFVGLGIQPPEVSLGSLINDGQGAMAVLPWLFFFPAGFLIAIILSINFIGDGLRDALDPSQRNSS